MEKVFFDQLVFPTPITKYNQESLLLDLVLSFTFSNQHYPNILLFYEIINLCIYPVNRCYKYKDYILTIFNHLCILNLTKNLLL